MSDNLFAGLLDAEREQQQQLQDKDTQAVTRPHDRSRDKSSDNSRGKLRDNPRDKSRERSSDNRREENNNHLPSRNEVQEFSFDLRDEVNVKVQAELPHQWRDELEQIAQEMRVKKLELYRYIYGVFLGKVRPRK